MLKTIKAEIYRLLHSKSFYITLLILTALVVLTTVTKSVGTVGVQVDDMENIAEETVKWSAYTIPFIQIQSLSILQYFFLPMLITVLGTDFSYATYKNTLCKGVGRGKYYFSKLTVLLAVCFFFTMVYILLPTIMGIFIYGTGGEMTWNYIGELFKLAVPQLIIMFLMLTLAGILLTVSKKTVACTMGYLLIPLVLQLVYAFLGEFNPQLAQTLFGYEVICRLNDFATNVMQNSEILKYTLLSIGYTAAAVFAGNYILKKADL